MLRLIIALGAMCFLVNAPPAKAGFVDGNELYSKCTTPEGRATYYQDRAYCMGYILAAADTIEFYETAEGVDNFVCVPMNVSSGQLRDVVLKFLKDNPASRHKGGQVIVLFALAGAFPCGEK